MNGVKDPVCGMTVFREQAVTATYGGLGVLAGDTL